MSRRSHRAHRGPFIRSLWSSVAASLAISGVALIVVACTSQQHAPEPSPSEAGTYALGSVIGSTADPATGPGSASSSAPASSSASASASASASVGRGPTRTGGGPGPAATSGPVGPLLAPATPTHVSIPAIGVDSDLMKLGLNSDGSVQVPPFERNSRAGWYDGSPAPGTLGPSVILGHIDSAKYGPGVFFKLGAMKAGDVVSVTRSDHTVAVFRVNAVAEYPKAHFPTTTVYGNTDDAALRLITCGGSFNFSERSYEDNIVVFASLVSSHRA